MQLGVLLVVAVTLNLSPISSNLGIDTVEATSYNTSRNTWIKKGNEWYHVNGNGTTETGWIKVRNKWYYMNASGVMQTGWNKVGSRWYYMNASGAMQTGWNKVGSRWYYMNASGAMNSRTGWNKIGRNWYYQLPSGAMYTGWRKVGNTWYYLKSNAIMQTGWVKLGNFWYYLNNSGAMLTNWQNIAGTNYYFDASGRMQPKTNSTSFNLTAIQREFHKLVNQERVANGKNTLKYMAELDEATGIRAYEIRSDGGKFSHTRPNGTSYQTAISNLTYSSLGENILRFGEFNSVPSNERIAEKMFNQWKNSPGHYANMMRENYTHQSLGVYSEKVGQITYYNGAQILYSAR